MRSFLHTVTITVLLLGCPMTTSAQWSTNPNVNNAICSTVNQQQAPRVASDGSGGSIITWWDYDLTTSNYNIYAQRINSSGIVQWTPGGVAICTNSLHQQNPEITSDGNGGAIIAWQDNRSGNCEIYAQRVNASGAVQWATDCPSCLWHDETSSRPMVGMGRLKILLRPRSYCCSSSPTAFWRSS